MEVSVPEEAQVLAFLRAIDSDVIPSLSSRVNLQEYASKICRLSVCVVAWHEDQIVGLSSAYCNDLNTKTGYVTLIAVAREFRSRGLATKLLTETIREARARNMKKLLLETNIRNKRAGALYVKQGFKLVDSRRGENTEAIVMEYDLT